MYARVLKFHICIAYEKIACPVLFSFPLHSWSDGLVDPELWPFIDSGIARLWDIMKSCELDISKTTLARALKLDVLINVDE